ncbi:MAG: pirin family protein [Planctomycetes bacterium]|nr:pirin family protein [Planctomycetota bacterium]
MITVREAADRGGFDFGWLDTKHTFSFGDYRDPRHMGFRALRVINEDRVAPGGGFPRHGHRDMEIVTYVLEGALEHRDSLGSGSVIRPGEVQRMSAGTGIEHSEANASSTDPVHLLQIWLLPARRGLAPGYEQRVFSRDEQRDRLRVVASPDGRDGSVTVHQDALLLAGLLAPGASVEHALAPGRHAWVQVARGRVRLGEHALAAGDGAALSEEPAVRLEGVEEAEVLVFDLA